MSAPRPAGEPTPAPGGPAAPAPAVRVKICGITRPEDALVAEAAGADAVGMVFAPSSRRRVSLAAAEEICSALGPLIARVGVFVDADRDEVVGLARRLRLSAVQLHGRETPEYARRLAREVGVVRAVAYSPGLVPDDLAEYGAAAVLLDAQVPGSGRAFAWSEAAPAWRGWPRLVLAGGLTPATVGAAIVALRPYAVDVASGVEESPGIKDAAAVRAFVAAAHAASTAG